MFYFDSKTARLMVPLYCDALIFQKAYIDRMLIGYADCKSIKHRLKSVKTAIYYCINNTQFVSFFVHRRKSRERFRIIVLLKRYPGEMVQFKCLFFMGSIYKENNKKIILREVLFNTGIFIVEFTIVSSVQKEFCQNIICQ